MSKWLDKHGMTVFAIIVVLSFVWMWWGYATFTPKMMAKDNQKTVSN